MLALTAYDTYVEKLFDTLKRFTVALSQAGIEYRVIGGMAVFLHVNERDTMAARLTNDIDVAVDRRDIGSIARAVEPFGFTYRHVARPAAKASVSATKSTAHAGVVATRAAAKAAKWFLY